MMDLRYREHSSMINERCVAEEQASMQQAKEEVFKCYDVLPSDIVDVMVSSDGKWQWRDIRLFFVSHLRLSTCIILLNIGWCA